MNVIRKELMDGVHLNYLAETKFKTEYVSARLILPLQEETAGRNALIPSVLRRGTARFPDMESLSRALDLLYGAELNPTVRSKGENQCVGFSGSFLNEQYLPEPTDLLEPLVTLMGEMLCCPATENGCFVSDYVEGEKQNQIDLIRSNKNDKRAYAARRLLQEMCKNEPYGLSLLGEEEDVGRIRSDELYAYYRRMLATSPVELFYCGSAPAERVERAFRQGFSQLPRETVRPWADTTVGTAPAQPRYIRERMDVTQGKLSMGFRCESEDWAALLMMNAMFGGSSMSKLFMNVREKLSLCYYASSTYHRVKRIITVSSGIECEKYQQVSEEILRQLEEMKAGHWEDWEQESALSILSSMLRSVKDSAQQREDYLLGCHVLGLEESPEQTMAQLQTVDRERIRKAARSVTLDTVYFLEGGTADADE